MKKCPNKWCTLKQLIRLDETKFCSKCGTELVSLPLCKYCESINIKSEIMPNENFCKECGRPTK